MHSTVLIVAKCNVNTTVATIGAILSKVLIVAKCNVNLDEYLSHSSFEFGINSSKV